MSDLVFFWNFSLYEPTNIWPVSLSSKYVSKHISLLCLYIEYLYRPLSVLQLFIRPALWNCSWFLQLFSFSFQENLMSTFLLMLIRFRLITKVQKIGKSELKNKNFLLHNLKSCLSPSPIWRLGWACQLYGGVHPFFDAIV